MIKTDLFHIRSDVGSGKSIYDMSLRVTFYARVSTDREEQINSLENQIMYFENLISDQKNWIFVPGYIDEGISGTTVKKRESFLKMIEDAKNNKFDLILTKEISRFSRSTLDSIKYTQELLSYGVGVHFMSDNINTFQPDSELRLTIMSSIAQEEIRKLSERVRFGYKRSVEKGMVGGSSNIYGYRKACGKLVVDDEQANIVKKIFEMYVNDNIGCAKIGHSLYHDGITNGVGKCIHASTIKSIIKNPKYKGYFCANKYCTTDYLHKKRKKFAESDWITYRDEVNVPPIISEETWNRANEILKKRSKKYANINDVIYSRKYPLSSRIFCSEDRASFIRGNYKLKNGKRFFWACANYRKNGKKKSEGCRSPIVYESSLVEVFKAKLAQIMRNEKDILYELINLINNSHQVNDYEKIKYMNTKELHSLNSDKENLIKMRLNGEINLEEYSCYKSKIDKRIEVVKNKLMEIEKAGNNKSVQKMSLQELIQSINDYIFNDSNAILEITNVLYNKICVHNDLDDLKRTHISVEYYDTVEHIVL